MRSLVFKKIRDFKLILPLNKENKRERNLPSKNKRE